MRVLSSLAIKEAYLELLPAFGRPVETEWLGMVDILQRVKSGEVADLVIASQKALGELKSLGKVEAVVDLTSRYLPAMVQRGRGAVVNIGSTSAFQPLPGSANYAASKAFVLSFSEAIRTQQEARRKARERHEEHNPR